MLEGFKHTFEHGTTRRRESRVAEIFKVYVENPLFYNWEQLAWIYSFVVNRQLSEFVHFAHTRLLCVILFAILHRRRERRSQ